MPPSATNVLRKASKSRSRSASARSLAMSSAYAAWAARKPSPPSRCTSILDHCDGSRSLGLLSMVITSFSKLRNHRCHHPYHRQPPTCPTPNRWAYRLLPHSATSLLSVPPSLASFLSSADQLTVSATYGWGSPDRKLGHVPRGYLRLHRSTETGAGAKMPRGRRCRSHPCDPSLPHGRGIGKGNRGMSDNEARAVPATNATASSGPAAGPLVVSETNPRYFTVAASDVAHRRAVYLTGSHVNNNFHDGSGPGADCAEVPEPNDFRGYLGFLKERGHNFIRLWRWEQFKSQVAGGAFHLCMTPQPWPRRGAGKAKDGKPKFDLSVFDPAYFDRLREYATAAANEGIYVSVMFFEGFGLHLSLPPDNVEGHPFYAANNVNEIGIASINDYQVLPLDPRVQALQEAYIRKVIDTVQDLPNVLYEVANESSGGG